MSKHNNCEKNLEEFKNINEKTKIKADKTFEEITNRLQIQNSFGNIHDLITSFLNIINTFFNSIKDLSSRIEVNFGDDKQNTGFHKVLFTILLQNKEIFKKISKELLEIKINVANQIEQSSVKNNEILEMYKKIKVDFNEKYNINFMNYKKYIETYNKIEKSYLNENKRDKKILENNKIDIKNNYENYLNSNQELNNYCNMTFPVSIEILNEYEKKNHSNDFIENITNKLVKSFEFLNIPLNLYTSKKSITKKEEGEEEEEEEEKNFDLSNVKFPFMKYNFSIINLIKNERNDNSNIELSKKMIKILEKLIEDYPNIIDNNDLKIEEEKKKLEIREFMTNLIEKNEIKNKEKINEILKEESFRNYFLKYINLKRVKGNFQIHNPEAMKVFGLIMKNIMEYNEKDKNFENTKLIVIMSQTYFYINQKGNQIYLTKFIKDNSLINNIEFWFNFLTQIITIDLNKELHKSNNNQNEVRANIVFTKIMTIIQNMDACEVPKEIIKKVVDESIQKYNLSNDLVEQINLIFENIKEKEIGEFDIEKEII